MDFLYVPPRAIVFDLDDVLFKWSVAIDATTTKVSPRYLEMIRSTPIWYSYERGEITQNVCYELSAEKFSLSASDIAEAFAQARACLQSDHVIVAFIRKLKIDPAVQVYAMCNFGKEDFDELATKMDWKLFDGVFPSAEPGMRKPELGFYRNVLDRIDLAGSQVLFIDGKKENVDTARALGIRRFVFGNSTIGSLSQTFHSPIGKGWRWLYQNANKCDSFTTNQVTFADNFAKLLIMETLQDQSIVNLSWGSRKTWNFFADVDERGSFPDDLDTTSLALIAMPPSSKTVSAVLDKMAEHANNDGTFQTYFDRSKKRVDPIVSANILACFYSYNRGHEFARTLQLVYCMLLERSYLQGTRYYSTPDICLGFIARLLRSSNDSHLHITLGPILKSRVGERIGLNGSALDLAMRITTCVQMGVSCESDRRALLDMQCGDGSWEAGWMYQYGSNGVKIGNCAVTTAMAVAALSSAKISSVSIMKPSDIIQNTLA
ncbi:hypothetical protein BofuT4_P066400.1 [Botrytis cinerea T4]|uniref:Had-like protein n=1 Tax=Botryotinia fuckeliana (strain T4) TaxID=999810 RepID=G2XRL9_BOTF4|nr:hypothetical protein BofuT4_P066400.1 [Botrytis cinerea T4]